MKLWKLARAGVLLSFAGSSLAQQTAAGDPYAQVQTALATHPEDAAAWYQLGSLDGQTGDFPDAAVAFRHAISLDSGMAKAHYSLALALIGNPQVSEDWAGAIAECREALKLQPSYPEALNLLGVGLTRQGQYEAAMQALKQAIQLSPAYPEAHFNYGLALESNERLVEAAGEYRAAIGAKGQYPEASSALGKLLLRMGETAEAEQQVTSALRANPDLTDAHYTRARILQALHRNQEAATEFAIFKELTARPANGIQAAQMSNQALAMAAKGDFTGAITLLQKAIALKPDYGVPHFNLGLILADQSKTIAAIQELSKAISLLPGQAPPWFELGRVLELAKNNPEAVEAIAWAAELAPSNQQIKAELARLHPEAPAPAAPPRVGAQANTGQAHLAFAQELNRRGDVQGATGELLRALTLQPALQEARRDLAAAYESLADHERALLEYRKLLVAFPTDASAHIALGKILLARGNAREAADEWKQALIDQPNSAEAQVLLRRVESPRRQP